MSRIESDDKSQKDDGKVLIFVSDAARFTRFFNFPIEFGRLVIPLLEIKRAMRVFLIGPSKTFGRVDNLLLLSAILEKPSICQKESGRLLRPTDPKLNIPSVHEA